jgi:putative transposase
LYHVTSRGNSRQRIFRRESDYQCFLSILYATTERFSWLVHAYCLMPNHYHLLCQTAQANLSAGMRYLNGVYAQRFNRRHDHAGHVLQGRFKAILVDRENYLLRLARYIVLNPVRAGLVTLPGEWRWSSYRATSGKGSRPRCLHSDWLLQQFGSNLKAAEKAYDVFVAGGLDENPPWAELKGGLLLGAQDFLRKIEKHLRQKKNMKGVSRHQRFAARPELDEIFAQAGKYPVSSEAVRIARSRYGYTIREIAAFLGIHETTLSKALNKRQPAREEG